MRLAAVLCFLGVLSCAEDATQVVVHFEADAVVVSRVSSIRVGVGGDESTVEWKEFQPDELAFPFYQPMHPRSEDATRSWFVAVELQDATGVFARQIARGVYVDGQRLEYTRVFSEACLGVVDCGDAGTCVEGACQPAWEATEAPQPSGAMEVEVPAVQMMAVDWTEVPESELTIVPGADEAGWVVLASARVASTRANAESGAMLRLVVNGRVVGRGGAFHTGDTVTLGPFQHFTYLERPSVEQRISLEVQDASGSDAVVEDARIVAFPVPPEAEPQFVELEHDDGQDYTTVPPRLEGSEYETPTDELLRLEVTADSEPYLLLAAVGGTERPGQTDLYLNWELDGVPLHAAMQFPRAAWTTAFYARVVQVESGGSRLRLLAAGSLGEGSRVSHARILALRADAFAPQNDFRMPLTTLVAEPDMPLEADLGRVTTADTAGARDYVIIQTANVGSRADCPVLLDFLTDDEGVSFDHQVDTSWLTRTFGRVDLLTTAAEEAVVFRARAVSPCRTQTRWSSTLLLELP
tara:strand:+ start:574 stop:2145 length:1572 start_codon:yes stop_codon:yes gene_type:complete